MYFFFQRRDGAAELIENALHLLGARARNHFEAIVCGVDGDPSIRVKRAHGGSKFGGIHRTGRYLELHCSFSPW